MSRGQARDPTEITEKMWDANIQSIIENETFNFFEIHRIIISVKHTFTVMQHNT